MATVHCMSEWHKMTPGMGRRAFSVVIDDDAFVDREYFMRMHKQLKGSDETPTNEEMQAQGTDLVDALYVAEIGRHGVELRFMIGNHVSAISFGFPENTKFLIVWYVEQPEEDENEH